MSSTPILDRQKAVLFPKRHRWVPLLAGGAIGAVGAPFFSSGAVDRLLQSPLRLGLFSLAALYLAILIHELGHLVMAASHGFRFRQIAVSPFVLSRESRGFRFRFVPGRIFAGGHVVAVPSSAQELRKRYLFFLAGGPAATALVFAFLPVLPWNLFTGCLLVMNLIMAAGSWLPYYSRGSTTDAKGIWILSRTGPESDRLAALLYLAVLDTLGTTPGQWPAEQLARLAVAGDSPSAAASAYSRFAHAMDCGDAAERDGALELALASSHHMRPDLRRSCFTNAALIQGAYRRDAALAREWLDDARKVKGAIPQKDWDAYALAGIALAENDPMEVRSHLSRAIALLNRCPAGSGSVAACRSHLEALMHAPDSVPEPMRKP